MPSCENRPCRVAMTALLHYDILGPPAGIILESPDIGGTRRQNLDAAIAEPNCRGCHEFLDPFGLALEHFDALGEYRTTEREQPVDASGTLRYGLAWTEEHSFEAWADLAPRLAESCDVAVAFALGYYAFAQRLAGQEPAPNISDDNLRDDLEEEDARRVVRTFMLERRHIASLPVAMAQSEAYLR